MQAVGSRVAGSRKDSIINRISLANFQSSTKIEALREELERMLQRDPSGKALVFSQFTSMLDLIAFRLQQVRPRLPCQVQDQLLHVPLSAPLLTAKARPSDCWSGFHLPREL